MQHGRHTNVSSDVAEQLMINTSNEIHIVALRTNTTFIALGNSEVNAAEGRESGIFLAPGVEMTFPVQELWMSVRTAGEGLTWWTQ